MGSTAGTPQSLHPPLLCPWPTAGPPAPPGCAQHQPLCAAQSYFLFFLQYLWGAIHRPENQSAWDENVAQRRRRGRLDFLRGQTWLWISISCTGILEEEQWTSCTRTLTCCFWACVCCSSAAVLNPHPHRPPSCSQSSRTNPPGETGTAAGTAPSKHKVLHSWNFETEYKPEHLQSWAMPRIWTTAVQILPGQKPWG